MAIEGLEKLGTIHVTLSERVYQELRRAVIHQYIPPGSQLRSQELAAALRVSRTPVKEALFRLRQEGLVDYSDRQGFFVSKVATEGLPSLFEARLICELFAVRKALPIRSQEALQAVRTALEEARRVIRGGDRPVDADAWYEADQALHQAVVDLADNQRISMWYDHLRSLTQGARFLGAARRPVSDYMASLENHEAIVEAISRGDVAAAEAALRRHSEGALSRLLARASGAKT